jgi:hypothetical protein
MLAQLNMRHKVVALAHSASQEGTEKDPSTHAHELLYPQ